MNGSGFKHTKGWKQIDVMPTAVYDENNNCVCSGVYEPNATLIAAAPEMLDIGIACSKYSQPYENESSVIVIKMPIGIYAKAMQTINNATSLTIDDAIKAWEADHKTEATK